ncbi:MAG: hypothetical protein K0R51_800 [Cytophagaceae bacterium]|nr:hypothetical protein [Cytophagaceae bacterium]
MWAVPIFLMISGYLLLGNPTENKRHHDRLYKFIMPFVFWNVFYFVVYQFLSSQYTVTERLSLFLEGFYSASHLWYLVLYIQLIILVPVINSCFINRSFDQMKLLLLIIGISIVQMFLEKHSFIHVINIFNPYILMVLLGYIFKVYRIKINLLLSFSIVLTLIVLGTCINRYYNSNIAFHYLSPINLLLAVFIFLTVQNIVFKKENSIVRLVSVHSFGIYLIHFIILEVLNHFVVINATNCLIIVLVVLTSSLLAAIVLSKIPYLKKIV